jgi:hypothetical protein
MSRAAVVVNPTKLDDDAAFRKAGCPDAERRIQFATLQVTLDQEQQWEPDGEVMGSTRRLTVVAQPGALLLRVPPESA